MSKYLSLWIMSALVATMSCFPVEEEKDCIPNLCEVAKFKCISQDSCNGTLVPPVGPCQCCPTCSPYLDEGDQCESEDKSTDETTNSSDDTAEQDKLITPDADINKERKCKPELVCLMGVCVHLH